MTASAGSRAYVQAVAPDAENRERDDFYPTPPEGTQALLRVERFEGTVWEPACGDGAMSRVLEAAGLSVISTDLIDRGYGTPHVDFLLDYRTRADNVVTNPPFKLAEPFARHALARTTGKVALLCRLAWLEGIGRHALFTKTPLARVWVFSRRLQIQRGRLAEEGDSGGVIAFAWFVWEHGHLGPPVLGWIEP